MLQKEEKKIRVLLLDHKSNLMMGITENLRRDKSIVLLSDAAYDTNFHALLTTLSPDIMICDIDYCGKCDSTVISTVEKESNGKTRVIAFSDSEDIADVALCFCQGAWGYELKNCHENEIGIAVRRISQGYHFICSSLSGDFFYDTVMNSIPIDPSLMKILTPTEKQVLTVIKNDGNAKDVALELKMAVKTARKHIEHIRNKLGVNSIDLLRRKLIYTVLEL